MMKYGIQPPSPSPLALKDETERRVFHGKRRKKSLLFNHHSRLYHLPYFGGRASRAALSTAYLFPRGQDREIQGQRHLSTNSRRGLGCLL